MCSSKLIYFLLSHFQSSSADNIIIITTVSIDCVVNIKYAPPKNTGCASKVYMFPLNRTLLLINNVAVHYSIPNAHERHQFYECKKEGEGSERGGTGILWIRQVRG